MKSNKMVLGLFSALAVVLVLGIIYFINKSQLDFRQNSTQIYTLVQDKISKSAPIIITLPEGVEVLGSEQSVKFLPEIKGEWVETPLVNSLAFKPASSLEVGKYYSVTYSGVTGEIKKDFMADEDPKVIDIFPKKDTEADESSAITIVFSRPMVPLTTLDVLEGSSVPVEISPVTKGKFKWISTRTLQFIPETTLVRSAHYSVKVLNGLVSMDGLPVTSFSHNFITRSLNFQGATADIIRYNQPIELRFNQPVDLEKIKSNLLVTSAAKNNSNVFRISNDKKIDVNVNYGERVTVDYNTGKETKVQDSSVVRVYAKADRLGRVNMWDTVTSYNLSLTKSYPLAGDIIYDKQINTSIVTTDILESVTAESVKTELASPALFDPEGTVTLNFYEDIDLSKSKIDGRGLKNIEYSKGCQKNSLNDYSYISSDLCIKVDNKKQLLLTFNPKEFNLGDVVSITSSKITNSLGQQINSMSNMVLADLHVYSPAVITKIIPGNNEAKASVKNLTICSNTPINPATSSAVFHQMIKADNYMVFGRWYNSYLQVQDNYNQNPPCAYGDYVTNIYYGLHPETNYKLDFKLEDVFGQSARKNISFRTETAPDMYMRFNNLQKIYNVTTPDKTTLTYSTENFDQVSVNICKVNGLDMVRYLKNQPSETTPGSSLNCVDFKTDIIDLPDTLWVKNYFQFDLKKYYLDPRGEYIISFGHPKYLNSNKTPIYDRTYLSVTNLAVGAKEIKWTKYDAMPVNTAKTVDNSGRGNLYWVNRISTLLPEAGAIVSVVHDTGSYGDVPQIAQTNVADSQGVVEFPLIKDVVGAVITSGGDTAIVSDWTDTLNWSYQAQSSNKVYLYTDRPIYRPGQEVNIKGLYRTHFDGVYEIYKDKDIDLKITNTNGDVIVNQKVFVNKYGTFNTKVTIPQDAPLGTYNITALDQYSFFEVQEYVGAAFEANTEINKEEYIAGDTASISVNAKYYFGVPLDGGNLEYTLTAQNYYFDRYTDEYFNFGGDWYNCYDCGYGDTYIKNGKVVLDDQGKVTIDQKLDFNTLFKETDRSQSKIVVLHGTIKDKQGKSVSFQRSFIVHRGDFYVGVKTDPSFTGKGQSFNLLVKTVDTQGKSMSRSGLSVDIQKVEWKVFKRQEVDGAFYNRYERVKTSVLTKNVSTDGSGNAVIPLTLNDAGEYEISIKGKDNAGNEVTSLTSEYIYGQGTVDVRQTNNATLDMAALNKDLKVGDNGSLIIQSPFKQAKALISIERGRILDYKIVDINQSVYNYLFKVTEDYIPNIFVSALLLSSDPQVKFGQLEFSVNKKNKELNIDVKSNKTSYLPGESVTLNITTSDFTGQKVPAEISIAVADLSVLALTGNQKKDPLTFFYDGFPLAVTTATNIKNILEEVAIPTGTKGGDGGNAGDLATRKRGEFKDTAFWQAEVVTDAFGRANVTFKLPDNLTRWQIESVGITEDTKLGVRYDEITSQKDVMLVPIKPRFVVPGDEFMIGAKVFNQTNQTQTLDISLSSETLAISKGNNSQNKTIKAGETVTVYFYVTAPLQILSGVHSFVLSAKNNTYNDTVENNMPIKNNTTFEAVATANSTNADSAKEYIYIPNEVLENQGGLTIKTSATLAIYLSDALKSLIEFPDGCSCSLASELSSLSIIKKSLTVKNIGEKFNIPPIIFDNKTYTLDEAVNVGLKKLYDLQNADGGFGYYKGLKSSLSLSISILNTLMDMKEAGIFVDSNVISRVSDSIVSQITKPKSGTNLANNTDTMIVALYALERANASGALQVKNLVIPKLTSVYLNEQSSSNSLAYLALLSIKGNYDSALKQKIVTSLKNRIEIDSRGAYIRSNSNNLSWQYYETPVKTTALFLKVLVANKDEFSETANMMRWLLASRSKDGAWGSANNTLAVVDAFSDYLNWKRETESNFSLDLKLDNKKIQTFDFSKDNILSVMDKYLPISTFEKNKIQTLTFDRTNRTTLKNNFYYDMSLKYYLPAEQITPRDEGIAIKRDYYSLLDTAETKPLSTAKVGEVIKGKLTIISPKNRNLFTINDVIPAGFELVNFNLATEDQTNLISGIDQTTPESGADNTVADTTMSKKDLYPLPVDMSELRDDSLRLFTESLSSGEYTYTYYIRATVPGTYRHLPAEAYELNFPENFGRTGGSLFTVTQ